MAVSQRKITVVGSYAAGLVMKAERLPTRGETLLGSGYRVDHGGKGSNQAVGCARLGAQVQFVARLGADDFGKTALRLYSDEGVETNYVRQTETSPTGVGFIMVEEPTGQNCILLDPGANDCLTADDVSLADDALGSSRVVLTQLEIPVAAARAAMERGRKAGALTLLNPAPVRPLDEEILACVDVLTPNESEARVLAGMAPDSQVGPEESAHELLRHGVKHVVVTLGERGALILAENSMTHVPAVKMRAVDTTGAGDAFNAGLATAMAFGADLEQSVQFAIITGGLAVTREGVIPALPNRETVLRYFRQIGMPPPDWLTSRLE